MMASSRSSSTEEEGGEGVDTSLVIGPVACSWRMETNMAQPPPPRPLHAGVSCPISPEVNHPTRMKKKGRRKETIPTTTLRGPEEEGTNETDRSLQGSTERVAPREDRKSEGGEDRVARDDEDDEDDEGEEEEDLFSSCGFWRRAPASRPQTETADKMPSKPAKDEVCPTARRPRRGGRGSSLVGRACAGPQYLFKSYSRFAASFLPKELLRRPRSKKKADAMTSDDPRRARMFANLTVGLTMTAILLLAQLFYDGMVFTVEFLTLLLSLTCYVGCLVYLRLSKNLARATTILIAYMNFSIIFRSSLSGLGLRSFSSDWHLIPPVFTFFMLGSQGGGVASVAMLLEILFLHVYGESGWMGVYHALDCVVIDPTKGTVYVPSNCHTYTSDAMLPNHVSVSPRGSMMSKILALSFLSGLAYVYENDRILALKRVKQVLAEKDRTNQSLREATEAKTIFLSNMSHELRTPMHGIIAMVKELLDMQLCEAARESAKILSDCAEHMMSLVDDILDFARIETNQLELECIPFDVKEEVDKAFNIHVILAKAKDVKLEAKTIELAHPFHIGDPLRFRQVLINLLSNAVKFTPPGGYVSVEVINLPSSPELISVCVSDTGIGIPLHSKGHVFQSFSQLDASVGRRYGGSGLGLAISKKLCEAMRGSIWYESEVGKGTKFYFTVNLPVTSSLPVLDSLDDTEIGDGSDEADGTKKSLMEGKKVLVVEDNVVNRRVALKMLGSLGCQVQMANDGAEGVDIFEKDPEKFDVILMDVQMPIMDGFQATARIRHIELERVRKLRAEGRSASEEADVASLSRRRHRRVPIIALTASATSDYQTQCLKKGMDRFLTKPLKKETLRRILEEVVGEGQEDARPAHPQL